MAYNKSFVLTNSLSLMMFSLIFVNASQKRSEKEYEDCCELLKKYCPDVALTAKNYAQGLVLYWDEDVVVDPLIESYHNLVLESMVQGQFKLRDEFCDIRGEEDVKKYHCFVQLKIYEEDEDSMNEDDVFTFAVDKMTLQKALGLQRENQINYIYAYQKYLARRTSVKHNILQPQNFCEYKEEDNGSID